jgi:hypothetical protein
MEGSFTTTSSLWMISVFAVPKSIAISWVKKLNKPIFVQYFTFIGMMQKSSKILELQSFLKK